MPGQAASATCIYKQLRMTKLLNWRKIHHPGFILTNLFVIDVCATYLDYILFAFDVTRFSIASSSSYCSRLQRSTLQIRD